MKCQACDQPATCHVTDIVDGKAVEFHVCEVHLHETAKLQPAPPAGSTSMSRFWSDRELREALRDPTAQTKTAAHLLPALCLALLDEKPEVKIGAAFRLGSLGAEARSALGALRDAQRDAHARVRKAAALAATFIESQ